MKKVIIILVFLISALTVWSAEGRVIPELVKPTQLQIEGTRLFVIEETTVHIFDLGTLKKIGQFGKAGQGPQEFQTVPGQLPLILSVQNNQLVVASVGKISRWNLNGDYISEFTYNPQNGLNPQYLRNNKFIALGVTQGEDQKLYRIVILCNEKMDRIKEIYRAEHAFQGAGKGLKVMEKKVFSYVANEDRIFLPGKEDNQIDAYDLDMKLLFTVSVPPDNRTLDQAFKDRLMEEITTNPNIKNQLEFLKPIIFPDKYPAISFFGAEGKRLFIFTWNWGKDTLEYYSFDTANGKELGKHNVLIKFQGAVSPYPITFKNNKVYQLVENEDEEWELISTPLQ